MTYICNNAISTLLCMVNKVPQSNLIHMNWYNSLLLEKDHLCKHKKSDIVKTKIFLCQIIYFSLALNEAVFSLTQEVSFFIGFN